MLHYDNIASLWEALMMHHYKFSCQLTMKCFHTMLPAQFLLFDFNLNFYLSFQQIANSILNRKVNLLYLLYSTARRWCCLLHLIKQNFSQKTFLITRILMTRVSTSFSRTNLRLHNISRTSKMVKNVITNLDSSKAFGCDCIPAVVLKNCELELSYILAELINICRKESCFPDSWKFSSVVPVFMNAGERSTC